MDSSNISISTMSTSITNITDGDIPGALCQRPLVTSSAPVNFLGVTIDIENGSSDPRIKKALDKSFKLLDIMEFIKVTKFKLNMAMFDYFSTNGPKAHSYDMLAAGCCRKHMELQGYIHYPFGIARGAIPRASGQRPDSMGEGDTLRLISIFIFML